MLSKVSSISAFLRFSSAFFLTNSASGLRSVVIPRFGITDCLATLVRLDDDNDAVVFECDLTDTAELGLLLKGRALVVLEVAVELTLREEGVCADDDDE